MIFDVLRGRDGEIQLLSVFQSEKHKHGLSQITAGKKEHMMCRCFDSQERWKERKRFMKLRALLSRNIMILYKFKKIFANRLFVDIFAFAARAASNQIYVPELDRIVLGNKRGTRSFLNVKVRPLFVVKISLWHFILY